MTGLELLRALASGEGLAAPGRVLCEGAVVHRGSRVATAEARLTAERTGKLLAHGTTTCRIFPLNGDAA